MIYLLYHLAWNQPKKLIPKNTGRVKTKPRSYSQTNVLETLIQMQIKREFVYHFYNLSFQECHMNVFKPYIHTLGGCLSPSIILQDSFGSLCVSVFCFYCCGFLSIPPCCGCTMVCLAIYPLKDLCALLFLLFVLDLFCSIFIDSQGGSLDY